jgi:hypothetical protein
MEIDGRWSQVFWALRAVVYQRGRSVAEKASQQLADKTAAYVAREAF